MADLSVSVNCLQHKTKEESGVKVKQERKDDNEYSLQKKCSSSNTTRPVPRTPIHSQSQARSTSVAKLLHSSPPQEAHPPPIDAASIRGAFGWTTINSVNLPFILRGEEKFLAVRMVESKIINRYADSLPWMVFTCTNIRSYYITENEAKLLNEINGHHCEFQFGYRSFTTRDVVVRLQDTCMFYEFLETCRNKLFPSNNNQSHKDKCGFVILNKSLIPYLRKGTKRYVPLISVQQEIPVSLTESMTISEWDLSYLRFLCNVTGMDLRKFKQGGSLSCLEDLCKDVLRESELQEWWPDSGQLLYVKNGKAPFSQWERFLRSSEIAQPFVHQQSLYRNEVELQKLREKGNLQHHFYNNSDGMCERSNNETLSHQAIQRNYDSVISSQRMHISSLSSGNLGWGQTKEDEPIMFAPLVNGQLAALPASGYFPPSSHNSSHVDSRQAGINASMVPISLSHSGLLRDSETHHTSSIGNEGERLVSPIRDKSFPPPPPLVRLGDKSVEDQVGNNEHGNAMEQCALSSQHHIGPPPPLHPNRLTSISQQNSSVHTNHSANNEQAVSLIVGVHGLTENISDAKRNGGAGSLPESVIGMDDNRDSTSQLSAVDLDAAAANVLARAMKPKEPIKESSQKDFHLRALLAKDDRLSDRYVSSPRMHFTVGPPPHYPTPPQSSPLQPLTVQVPVASTSTLFSAPSSLNEVLTPRTQDIIDLCSPPPSPDSRVLGSPSKVQQSPHPAHQLSSFNSFPQGMDIAERLPHHIQLVEVEGRQIPAVNIEPHVYNSQLVTSVTNVVAKLFPPVSVQSFVFVLQSVLGVRLHECSRVQQHIFMKHGHICMDNERLVSVVDLKAYMPQLKYMFKRSEKGKDDPCSKQGESEEPAAKRWCNNGRES